MADESKNNVNQQKTLAARLESIVAFVQNNTKIVSGIGIGIVVIAVVTILMIRSKRKANKQASGKLGIAQMSLQAGDTSNAVVKLENLISRYEGTQSAGYALALLGQIESDRGSYQKAQDHFNRYLREYKNKKFITTQVLQGLGNCLYVSGNYKEAAQKYEKAARTAPHKFQKHSSLLNAAKCYLETSQISKSQKLVEEVKNSSPEKQIKSKLQQIESQIAVKKT